MADLAIPNTIANGQDADGDKLAENFSAIETFVDTQVAHLDGSKPFTGLPLLPAQDPANDNQAARKAYVDRRDGDVMGAMTNVINAAVAVPTATLATHRASGNGDHDARYLVKSAEAPLVGNAGGTAIKVATGGGVLHGTGAVATAPTTISIPGANIIAVFVQVNSVVIFPVTVGAANFGTGSFTVTGSGVTTTISGDHGFQYLALYR